MDELLSRLTISFAIGLLVGLERGWHSRDSEDHQRAAGLRTFTLSGLLGGVAAAVAAATAPIVLGLIFIGYAAAFTAFQWLESRANNDLSATSAVAGLLTFALGAFAVLGDLRIAIAAAVAMTLVLALRERLHRWVAHLRHEEIRAVLILLTMTFLLLPILPDRAIDPWGSVNPAEIWLLAIMIAAISFGGYVAVRLFGDRLGLVMAAVSGGLASSTATTLTLARLGGKDASTDRLISGAILVSGVVMVVRVAIVAALLNRAMILPLLPIFGTLAIVMAAAAAVLLLTNAGDVRPEIEISNPLELGMAIKLALIIAVVMFAAEIVQDLVGEAGLLIIAGVSGIADVDAINISMARLGGTQISVATASRAVALAVGVNTLSKAVMAGSTGGRTIGAYVGGVSILACAAAAAAALLAA
jgi:uncharacterized membrane protein (DUF4010 family)